MADKEWRCFHCDEMFTDEVKASEHFGLGDMEADAPACKLNELEGGILGLLRATEAELRRWQLEDNNSCREFYALGAEHSTALRREEEKGYARGLRDGRAISPSNADVT